VVWGGPAPIVFGMPLGDTQLNATASIQGAFLYSPSAGTVLSASEGHTLSVQFSPSDVTNYKAASTTVSLAVLYDFHGFFQPVDNPGAASVYNATTAGRAIPVKFGLGGNHGLAIFEPGYPGSKAVACGTNPSLDQVEETLTAGGSSLTYDGSQYVYVWKTDKSWAGTCRKLDLKLADGTTHSALFRFTK
jgi:hypothetical protein